MRSPRALQVKEEVSMMRGDMRAIRMQLFHITEALAALGQPSRAVGSRLGVALTGPGTTGAGVADGMPASQVSESGFEVEAVAVDVRIV